MLQNFINKNYYERLNVPRTAPRESIVRAFRDLAALYHPDRHKVIASQWGVSKQECEEIFHLITQAYNTLSDVQKRAEYDRTLPTEYSAWQKPKTKKRGLQGVLEARNSGCEDPSIQSHVDLQDLRRAELEPHAVKFPVPEEIISPRISLSEKFEYYHDEMPRRIGAWLAAKLILFLDTVYYLRERLGVKRRS